MTRLYPATILVVALCSAVVGLPRTAPYGKQDQTASRRPTSLTPGNAIDRRLAVGESDKYQISLATGDYCRVTLASGENVVVVAYLPNGEEFARVASDDSNEYQHLLLVADHAGSYSLKIQLDDESKPGSYRILMDERREASESDRSSARAQQDFIAAEKLEAKATKDANLEAIKGYERALALWTGAHDDEGRAVVQFRIGSLRFRLGDAKGALDESTPALTLSRSAGLKRLESCTLEQIGSCYIRLSEYQKALDYLSQSLAAARSIGDRGLESAALQSAGLAYSYLSQFQKALDYYSQALTLYQALGDRAGEGTVLSDIGLACSGLSQYEKSLEYFKQALPISESAGDRPQVARVLNNTGLTYYRLSEYDKALEYFNRSLPIRREIGDRSGEAITLSNIGLVYRAIAQYEKAADYYNQALPILHEIGNRAGEAVALSNLGVAYTRLGQTDKALDCFNRSLPVSHEVGNKAQEASTLNNLGIVNSEIGRNDKALGYFTQSLAIQQVIGDRMQQGGTLDNIGMIYNRLGQTDRALDYYNQSLAMSRAVQDRVDEGMALTNVAMTYSGLGQYQKAQEFYGQALTIARNIGDRYSQSRALEGMARVYRSTGDLAQARSAIEQSIAVSESVRSEVSNDQSRSLFFASSRGRFDFYISLLAEMYQKHPEPALASAALEASERSRARSLLDLMAVSHVDINQGVDPLLKTKEQAVYSRISRIQSQLIQANSRSNTDASRISSLESQLSKADDERQQLEIELRRSSPRYADLKYPAPLSAASIKKLIDPDTLLLEYSLGRDGSFLFAVTNSDVQIARLCPADQIRGEIDRLRVSITSPGRAGLANYLASASELYRQLLAPASSLLEGKKRLVIVPDGPLYYLPFEVLLQKTGSEVGNLPLAELPYLVRDYSVSYVPSVSVLAMLGTPHGEPVGQAQQKDFIAFADPEYGNEGNNGEHGPLDAVVRGTFGVRGLWKLDRLPGSRTEVERIAGLFPAGQSSLFLGSQATEENVKEEGRLAQYRYIHFAVHGLLDESQPQFTSLILSLPQPGPAGGQAGHEDGLLQEFEIFNLKLRADLVTLSACETGLGKEVNGEGFIGLSRAFFYAGAPSLLVSLWKVDDQSTANLMESFYGQLKQDGDSKAEALRQAKLRLIRSGSFAHPYYWAPFVLTGKTK